MAIARKLTLSGVIGVGLLFAIAVTHACAPNNDNFLSYHWASVCNGPSVRTLSVRNGVLADRDNRFVIVECPDGKFYRSAYVDKEFEPIEPTAAQLAVVLAKKKGWTITRVVSNKKEVPAETKQ